MNAFCGIRTVSLEFRHSPGIGPDLGRGLSAISGVKDELANGRY